MKRLTVATIFLLALPLLFAVAAEYKFAAPLPGGKTSANTIVDYAQYFFPVLLSVTAGLALVVFVIGAAEYMASGGNPSRMGGAKDRMTNAIFGLLLAITSVLILRTINPNLLNLELNLEPVGFVNQEDTSAFGGACSQAYRGHCQDGQACIKQGGTFQCVQAATSPSRPTCTLGCEVEGNSFCNSKGQNCEVCTLNGQIEGKFTCF